VQDKLVQFCGVGRKVADCVALFSLKQDNSIPVDVHVWNIARRDYDTERLLEKIKSLTPAAYRQVGDLFRDRFKTKSGWAHSCSLSPNFLAFSRPYQIIDSRNGRYVIKKPISLSLSLAFLYQLNLLNLHFKFREVEQGRKEAERVAKKKRKTDKEATSI
jgi:hypothetical protein